MSVADQINRIKTNIANTYTAAQAKGATIPQTQNSDNLATCVQSITTGGGGGSTQFGLTAEQMLGTVDSEGNLTMPTLPSITFTGLKSIPNSFSYRFYQRTFEDGASVSFPDLTSVVGGMDNSFAGCTSLTSVNLSALTTVYSYGMANSFAGCTSLTSVNLSALTTVYDYGLGYCFGFCSLLTSVELPALTTVGDGGLSNCFAGCPSLTTISFPALTDVQTSSFEDCFVDCTALTEIHFRADMQATIEALSGYANKFGAPGATIYFSL